MGAFPLCFVLADARRLGNQPYGFFAEPRVADDTAAGRKRIAKHSGMDWLWRALGRDIADQHCRGFSAALFFIVVVVEITRAREAACKSKHVHCGGGDCGEPVAGAQLPSFWQVSFCPRQSAA